MYDGQGKPTVLAEGFHGNDIVVRSGGRGEVPGWGGELRLRTELGTDESEITLKAGA